MMSEEALKTISDITELNDISSVLQDKDVDTAMEMVIKIIAKPNMPPQAAVQVIVQLQALAAKFGLMAASHTYLTKPKAGTDEYKKKALYYALSEHLNSLVAAIKYVVKG